MTTKLLSCALVAGALAANLVGQTPTAGKTVTLQVQAAVLGTREGHQVFSALDARFAVRKSELDKKQADIRGLQDQLQKAAATMSEEAQRQMARDIDRKTKAWNYDLEAMQTDYEQEQTDTMRLMERKFRTVVDKYARDKGFAVVLDVGGPQSQAFWSAGAMDITNEVVRAYDAAYPAPGVSDSPAPKQ